jgi:TorA maturation chaperone TorD
MNKEAVNPARSLYYGLFSKLLVFTTDKNRYEGIKDVLDVLIENPLDENSKEALKEIKEFIELGGHEILSNEYDDIFHNPVTPIVRNTASFYDEGVESGKKTLEVKNFLAKTRIRRDEKNFKEPEDSIGFLVTFMHELIELIIKGEKSYETLQHCLFAEVINEFIDEFITNLYEHDKANAYKSLAVVLNAFITFERLYFDVTKPKIKNKSKTNQSSTFISDKEAARRAKNRIEKAAQSLQQSCALEDSYFEDDGGIEM